MFYMSIPEKGGSMEFTLGETIIDFNNGTMIKSNGEVIELESSLSKRGFESMQSFAITADRQIHFIIEGENRQIINAHYTAHINNISFKSVKVVCDDTTNVQIMASTNPHPDMGQAVNLRVNNEGKLEVIMTLTAHGETHSDGTDDIPYSHWVSKEIFLDENKANVANKPSHINIGLFYGYSLPEYAAGEELNFRIRVPHDWDGVTNPWFVAISIIMGAEDIGDNYKFQLEWQSIDIEHVIPATIQETLTNEVSVTDGTQYFAKILAFELDATTLIAGQNLQMRLRRIVATAPSVTNEIGVMHWDSRWKVNKLGTASIQGY